MSDPWGMPPAPPNDPWGAPPPGSGWGSGAPAQPEPQHQQSSAPSAPPPSADEFMDGGGIKGFSFKGTPPMRLGGPVIEEPQVVQKRDFDSKLPLYWNDQNKATTTRTDRPVWVLVVKCQTDEHADEGDDGVRGHYIEYNKKTALLAAMRPHGVSVPAVGSHVFITYEPPEPPSGKPKKYSAEYYPPGVVPPAAPASTPPGWGAPPPPAQAAGGPPPAAQIAMKHGASQDLARALLAAGMTAQQASLLPKLSAGWQGAPAEQIMPYLRQLEANEPPF